MVPSEVVTEAIFDLVVGSGFGFRLGVSQPRDRRLQRLAQQILEEEKEEVEAYWYVGEKEKE